jgi:hypothetical protein
VTVRAETEDDFVAKVQQHGREAHDMDVTVPFGANVVTVQ